MFDEGAQTVQKRASLHEKTVQKLDEKAVQKLATRLRENAKLAVAAGDTKPKSRRKRKADQLADDLFRRRQIQIHDQMVSDLQHLIVDRTVWDAAKKIVADEHNTYTRIEILDEHEVLVR